MVGWVVPDLFVGWFEWLVAFIIIVVLVVVVIVVVLVIVYHVI